MADGEGPDSDVSNVSDLRARISELDGRVRELEAVQELILRIVATTKPLDALLDRSGATATQEQAVYKLLDDLVARMNGRPEDRPTFAYFEMKLGSIFPALRSDKDFVTLLIDTLKVERSAYRDLHKYMTANRWPG